MNGVASSVARIGGRFNRDGLSHAGARRPRRGRLDDVNPNVDQGSPNYHGQETEDAHYRVVH